MNHKSNIINLERNMTVRKVETPSESVKLERAGNGWFLTIGDSINHRWAVSSGELDYLYKLIRAKHETILRDIAKDVKGWMDERQAERDAEEKRRKYLDDSRRGRFR